MYLISKQIYLDNHNKCYKTIIIINSKPQGKLQDYITNIRLGKLAESENLYGCCNKNICNNIICNTYCNISAPRKKFGTPSHLLK